uniref:Coiled-coil domain-containing protein SCD2-like n=1 Tax=Tanacetum cinerariifolium TaxID=118510 RepID=A0A6L2JP62_TANCI|nr:coiled-coil domain-containing protein SCD2-like [Tanacetum cinerariifolium]
MMANVNVLGPRVMDVIARQSNGTTIITIQRNLVEVIAIVERCEESKVRAKKLEKQAALRAAAAQNATHNNAIRGGVIDAIRLEAETAREEATSVMEQLYTTECEVRSLKTMIQRMVLKHEEMVYTIHGSN